MSSSGFIATTAQKKIAKLRKRVRVVQGGTSSSKTFSILPFLFQYAKDYPRTEISVVSESVPHLKRGAYKDFVNILVMTGNFFEDGLNKSEMRYTLTNGSFVEFFSADQPDKLRGARRDVLFINECNNIAFEAYQQLSIRTKKFIYLDYNPTSEFWVHSELLNDIDTDFVKLTYKDNEALDPAIVKEIEKARDKAATSSYWANWWKVYGLGEVGSLEGVIFNNWKQIDTIPEGARLVGKGLDFGYSNDPAALVDVYKWNDSYIVEEALYRTGMLNKDIAAILNNDVYTYADSAEPKSIDEIKTHGITKIQGATKGADSITYGIQLLQGINFFVTARSTNLIKELRGYCWDKDKNGNQLAKPVGSDHLIDALRYWAIMSLSQPKSWTKFWV